MKGRNSFSGSSHLLLREELRRVEDIAREKVGLDLNFSDGSAGSLHFDLKGLRAGLFSARPGSGGKAVEISLRFNGEIIERVGEEDFRPTVAHEFAHAAVYVLMRKAGKTESSEDFRPHGELWKALMRLFGHPPDRCHTYPVVPARRRKFFGYRCIGCRREYRLGAIRHERFSKNPGYLVCGRCRGPLHHEPETPAGV